LLTEYSRKGSVWLRTLTFTLRQYRKKGRGAVCTLNFDFTLIYKAVYTVSLGRKLM
jgi:hypothetical protein